MQDCRYLCGTIGYLVYNGLQLHWSTRMMINHSTLEYHVTNLNTFFRWLWRKNQNPNTTLTLNITLTTTITQTTTKTLTLTRNLTLSLKWPCHVMSRDRCSFFAYNWSGKHFNPTSCGVIRNQRSKIRRSNITSTAGCPF